MNAKLSLPKLPFNIQKVLPYTWRSLIHFVKSRSSQVAASLTYTTLLSLIPMLTLLLVILSSVPILEPVREQVYANLYENMMPESGVQVKQYITTFTENARNITTIGILVLFYTTMATLMKIEQAFNHIWDVSSFTHYPNKSKVRNIVDNVAITVFRYLIIILLVPLILGFAFIASAAIGGLSFVSQLDMSSMSSGSGGMAEMLEQIPGVDVDWITDKLSSMGSLVWARVLSVMLTALGFMAMYWFIPKTKVPIRSALYAGIVVTLLFEAVKTAFGFLIGKFTSYSSIYGAFAVLPVFLIWINLSWSLILLGVSISQVIATDTKDVG